MPLYEYQCQKCRQVVEVIQKLSDEPLKMCSGCGGPLERLLSAPAIQFKGSGWYITDYARKSNGSGSGSGSGDKKTTGEPAAAAKTASEKAS